MFVDSNQPSRTGGQRMQCDSGYARSMTDRDLQLLVDRYIRDCRPRFRRSRKRYRDMVDLATAVESAGLARTAEGKCESHQCRVGLRRLRRFHHRLSERLAELQACADFGQLHDVIARCRVKGVGTLAIYDTAVRIGWHLGLEPEAVYLHAGTRQGARAIGVTAKHAISRGDLSGPLHALSPSELEDFLCIFAEALAGRVPVREAACTPVVRNDDNCRRPRRQGSRPIC